MNTLMRSALIAGAVLSFGIVVEAGPERVSALDSPRLDAKEDKKNFSDFKKRYDGTKVNKERSEIAQQYFEKTSPYYDGFEHVISDQHWLTRWAAQDPLRKLDASTRLKLLKEAIGQKSEDIRHHFIYAIALLAEEVSPAEWELLAKQMEAPKESFWVKATIARALGRWPVSQDPSRAAEPKNEEEKKAQEEAIAKIIADAQALLKTNFEILLKQLEFLTNDKKLSKDLEKGKNDELTWYRNMIVYSLERLSSQEWSTDYTSWKIWWDENRDKPLNYRFDRKLKQKVGEAEVDSRYVERKIRKFELNSELLMLPDYANKPGYYSPYLDDMTQYFNRVSFFELPDATHLAGPRQDGRQSNLPANGYYYPLDRVAKEIFLPSQKNRELPAGMIANGMSSPVAMHYAYEDVRTAKKKDDRKVPFIVCINPWVDFGDMSKSVQQLRGHKNEVWSDYGLSRSYPDNQKMTAEQSHNAGIGRISALFSNPQNPWHIEARQAEYTPEEWQARSRGSAFIDDSAKFDPDPALGKEVPALFIFGKDDPQYVSGTDKKCQKAFPNCTIVFMEGAGRMPWVEKPEEFKRHVLDFVQKTDLWKEAVKARESDKKN